MRTLGIVVPLLSWPLRPISTQLADQTGCANAPLPTAFNLLLDEGRRRRISTEHAVYTNSQLHSPLKYRSTSYGGTPFPGLQELVSSKHLRAPTQPSVRKRVKQPIRLCSSQRWLPPTLQGPFGKASRVTIRRELVPGHIWAFEQVQGVIYVHVPVRMTAVKLKAGGLFVYSAVAPTAEMLRLLSELEAEVGPVRHILLPSLALEHKFFAGDLARARPAAQLWVAPCQFSYPLELPLWLQGLTRRARPLPPAAAATIDADADADANRDATAAAVPWADELPYLTLGPLKEKVGMFQEVVVFHRESGTLLVTDLLVSVPSTPPAVVAANDKRALLFHARDSFLDEVADTPAARAEGWKKIALFSLFFQCSALDVASPPDGSLSGALSFFRSAFPRGVPPSSRALGWAGFWPFDWQPQWRAAFSRLRSGGRPVVPPILQVSVLNREPEKVLAFADAVAEAFPLTKLVPCHFDAPVAATTREWSAAFDFLRGDTADSVLVRARRWLTRSAATLPDEDLAFLRDFDDNLVQAGAIRPPAPKVSADSKSTN